MRHPGSGDRLRYGGGGALRSARGPWASAWSHGKGRSARRPPRGPGPGAVRNDTNGIKGTKTSCDWKKSCWLARCLGGGAGMHGRKALAAITFLRQKSDRLMCCVSFSRSPVTALRGGPTTLRRGKATDGCGAETTPVESSAVRDTNSNMICGNSCSIGRNQNDAPA